MKHYSASNNASREAAVDFAPFVDVLRRWNRTLNLISPADEARIEARHLVDSLQLGPLIPSTVDRAIDLGSGAGFPGLVLSAATRLRFDLIESDQRKAAFLREAARILGAPVQVHAQRIETVRITPAPLVTARALAPLPRLLALAARLLAPGGVVLLLKGGAVESELTAANREWHMRVERFPSRTSATGVILRITELARVPPAG